MEKYGLTYFLFGGGQDSTYILLKLIHDKEFRARHIQGRLIVAMSDTGNEHNYTYSHVSWIQILCKHYNIEFVLLKKSDGYHGKTWPSLTEQYRNNKSIGSAAFRQTCTDNLKVKPTDNFLEDFIKREYGYTTTRKKAIYQFAQDHGMIRLILGFAKGEERRTSNGNKFDAVWKKTNVERYYPLIIDGIDRQDCINYNEITVPHLVYPSNCKLCLYQSDQEVLWLSRFLPEDFKEWQELEKAKIRHYSNKGINNNHGVYGKITLAEKLEKAEKLYGHWTNEQLHEYKYSHGHCIKTKY